MSDCGDAEPFALRVIGQSMAPEFAEGEVIVVEPDGAVRDGVYVVALAQGEWTLRQLIAREGRWWLHPCNPAWPDAPLDDLAAVRGVVIQATVPGRRRLTRRYT